MLRRQHPGEFHAYPDHRPGVSGVIRRLLWRLGFDPLTVYERLAQVRREAADWKRWCESPTGDNADQTAALVRLGVTLSEALTPEGVDVWLHGRNAFLDDARPIDLLEAGEVDVVERVAVSLGETVAVADHARLKKLLSQPMPTGLDS